ncbi:malate dehydrogenase (oxaloacetate-decarboxylating) [Branchiibius hedensis]|uniref:Malate dehydrogenase (Oxaloacetate-decarboxylating) n=1 Tax=Branchiibius hedensis TaxID=672460 RepID=A0A2Y8ZSB5_9MICO|nr:malate dehydrogenase (oxaloacetate-decarboxylating) [Branchiibius hedensis]SSA35250.1 malate dehydrogenase (oxaloacetate-decarboxylating) [Branchiibius hedensis]
MAAAEAIAGCVAADELTSSYIIPSVFDTRVAPAVAAAVQATAVTPPAVTSEEN